MSTMSTAEALEEVLKEMEALSPEELRAELDKHRNGSIAVALREASQFLYEDAGYAQIRKPNDSKTETS